MTSVGKQDCTEKTRELWEKLVLFKQQYKDNADKVASLEENLAKVNVELSLARNENAYLSEQINLKQTSLSKFQQIVEDLVGVQEKYRTLLLEKKKVDEELVEERKLRLSLEKQKELDKIELAISLQNELQTLGEHAASKEKDLENKYSAVITEQKEEIESMKHNLMNITKQYKEEITKMKQDLETARKESLLLQKRIDTMEETWSLPSKNPKQAIGGVGTESSTKGQEDIYSFREDDNQPEPSDSTQVDLTSRNSTLKRTAFSASVTSQAQSGKTDSSPLEIFRFPSRITRNKSSIKRKRKLYSRNDDMI